MPEDSSEKTDPPHPEMEQGKEEEKPVSKDEEAKSKTDDSKEGETNNTDNPKVAIKDILTIVDQLHTQFGGDKVLSKFRSGGDGSSGYTERKDETERYIPKLRRNLRLLQEDVVKLQELRSEVAIEVNKHIIPLQKLFTKLEKNTSTVKLTKGMKKDLEDINKKIFNLMCQVPLLPNKGSKGRGADSQDGYKENDGKGIVCLPGIHANINDLKERGVYKDVLEKFKDLKCDDWKICLLSLAVFPENQEVNRTMLMYWWIGEGILPDKKIPEESKLPDNVKPEGRNRLAKLIKRSSSDKDKPVKDKPEEVVKAILKEFVDKKLIEPVQNKRKLEPNSYKMTPFVHSALVLISGEMGLFDMYDKGKKPIMRQSELHKVCLVEESSTQREAKAKNMKNLQQIETVFNVSERFPDFSFKWFSEEQPSDQKKLGLSDRTYDALKVFYLGRWERTAKRHIEVENPELMRNLKHMTKLRLLSFQGISRIERLHDAVCKLHELIILDLRACYNLEKLPDKIDSLKKLIYLDITDCYMIDRMPKRLSWLDNLEVLKGFVVSDATDDETVCLLSELEHLKKLRKLSIIINKRDFSVDDLFRAIFKFQQLEKLKVAWGGMNERLEDKGTDAGQKDEETKKHAGGRFQRTVTKLVHGKWKAPETPGIPDSLRKLDLQCLPSEVLPKWLEPKNLLHLKKLYIKGGIHLTGFGTPLPEEPTECNVSVLRLKFLPRLKVEWRDLSKIYFPKLEFLEKYQCPQVSLCPCDGTGIWREA